MFSTSENQELILLLNQDFKNLMSLIYSFSFLQLDQSDQAHEIFYTKMCK